MIVFPIPRAQFESIRVTLAEKGIILDGDKGTIQYRGVTAEYAYHQNEEMLTMTIIDKPSFAGWGYVEKQVRDGIKAALEALDKK